MTTKAMLSMVAGGVATVAGMASMNGMNTAWASTYTLAQKNVSWNGHVVSSPMGIAAVDPSTGKLTTYMPIWYVMQALNATGIQSSWDGTDWNMHMPSGQTPTVNLSTVNPGSGQKHMVINGVDVQNVNGIVYPDPASHVDTTYIPIWYVMKVLGYEGVNSKWNAQQWTMTKGSSTSTMTTSTGSPTTTSTTGSTTASAAGQTSTSTTGPATGEASTVPTGLPTSTATRSAVPTSSATHQGGTSHSQSDSGVSVGAASNGNMPELWTHNGQAVTLDNISHALGSNQLPIKGHVTGNRRDDVVVEVVQSQDKNWFYSVPVDANGNFAVTITLPYQGKDYVNVGYATTSSDSFGLNSSVVYGEFQNNQPTLTTSQMALLQSWMVNYNESVGIHSLASQITATARSRDEAIKDISDWVSSHIYYNFPQLNQGTFTWEQATKTLTLRNGVCQDQAAVAAALLRSLGIPTQVIDGEAYDPTHHQDVGGHAWNKAWDGTKWVTFDSTWDQQYFQDTKVAAPVAVVHTYFNPTSASFNKTHVPDPIQPFEW